MSQKTLHLFIDTVSTPADDMSLNAQPDFFSTSVVPTSSIISQFVKASEEWNLGFVFDS